MLISIGDTNRTSDTDYTDVLNRTGDTIYFGIIGIQTNDTLSLSDNAFFQQEELKLTKAGFNTKPKTKLLLTIPLIFNGCILIANTNDMILRLKG